MERLKALRAEKGISQQKLADDLNTHQQSIYQYENGLFEPDIQTLKLLANYFETSVDYLVGNTDIRHRIEPVTPFDLNEEEAALMEALRCLPPNARVGLASFLDAIT